MHITAFAPLMPPGRVARLVAHAMLLRFGVGSSIWSVARGLARNVERYKSSLMLADEARHNDLDGRGALSERRLREFCDFETCVDQVHFMESLLAGQLEGVARPN